MTKNDLKKLIKSLTKEILAEDYKGEPNLYRDSELSRREKNLIDQAIKKFPKAKRIDVENFTSRYDHLSGEAALNLLVAAAEFRKTSSAEEVEHYINAISWVLNHKHA